jgi:glutathione S-transferase
LVPCARPCRWNLNGDFPDFTVWTRAQADIDRITEIWRDCLDLYGGPFLLGARLMADAIYAPVVTTFLTYQVKLDDICGAYCRTIMAMPEMIEWIDAAKQEPENVEELEVDFLSIMTPYSPLLSAFPAYRSCKSVPRGSSSRLMRGCT